VAVGILGGVFDPPHMGHVALARAAVAQLGLDQLLVLVIEVPGHKDVATPIEVRLELARLAFSGIPGTVVELDRHGRSVDSLEERRPHDAYFILGADELADFWTWKRPERVLELVRLAVAPRPGVSDDDFERALADLPARNRVVTIAFEPTPVSSTEVRARVARGESIDGLVPEEVARAIARLGLYAASE
jgi:nicotinate-nucleotide adenylyltransferase